MKKLASVIFATFLLLCPVFFCGCQSKEENLSSYSMDLKYQPSTYSLEGNMVVEYFNKSDNSFKSLYFHLYPNAFRQDAKFKPVASTSKDRAYPHGDSYGSITINGVFIDSKPASFEITGDDLNILKVDLNDELFPEERVTINIVFVTYLANVCHRLGYGDDCINFGNFYPIACVYENGVGFMTKPYSANGDPFYSDVANYEVTIAYPEKFVLASSGEVVDSKTKDGQKVATITGRKIRDFCFVLSDKFQVLSKQQEGTTVRYFSYKDSDPDKSLATACQALSFFNKSFGKYPYPELNVVETNFVYGGMEYPNLVMISDDGKDRDYVIVHEIAHQWWYGVVGNDQYLHAWQDESLTDYSAMLYFQDEYDDLIDGANTSYKLFVSLYDKINLKADTRMERPLDEFNTEAEYVSCIYTKGVLMYDTLKDGIGEKKLLKMLKSYCKNYAYQNASPAEMIACFERASGVKLKSFFDNWLNGKVVVL